MKFISATSFLLISSGFANAAPQPNIDTPGGMCASDNDCYMTVRTAVPLGFIGPGLCECYAASTINTFDETEDSSEIRRARCGPSACDGYEAYCPIAPNDNGLAECALRRVAGSSSSSLPSDDTPTTSSSSDDTPRPPKRPGMSSSSSSDDTPRLPKRPGVSSSSSSDDTPRPQKRADASSSSSSSDDTPRPQKRADASSTSTSSSSDDSSSSNGLIGIISPTPAPPPGVKVMAEM